MKYLGHFALTILLLSLFSGSAFAAVGGGALPWEAPLALIVTSITGPVAYTISVIGIVIAGGMLIFGADLNRFGQAIIYLVLVIGFIVAAVNTMQTLFGAGAVTDAAGPTLGLLMLVAVVGASMVLALAQKHVYRFFNDVLKNARRQAT